MAPSTQFHISKFSGVRNQILPPLPLLPRPRRESVGALLRSKTLLQLLQLAAEHAEITAERLLEALEIA